MTAVKKYEWNFHLPPKADTCAKFQLSRLIFIFISCQQLLTAFDSWWQLSHKKFKWDFHLPPKAKTCAKFQLSRLIFIFTSCQQLLTADDSCHKKNLNGIFIYPLKLIPVPNFSSLGWFSFLSAVNSCWQLLTADDSCHKKSLNGIFIYPLKLILVPNFSSPGCLGA